MVIPERCFANWWNQLDTEQRTQVIVWIPPCGPEQAEVFSIRLWHELHAWMWDHLKNQVRSMLSHFRLQPGDRVNGVLYREISDHERQLFPLLGEAYAIAVLEPSPETSNEVQFWIIDTEAEYDENILLSLSGLGLPNRDQAV